MNNKLNILLKVGVLAASGLMFYSKITSGTLAFYINQRFAWLSLVAVLLFVVMALTVTYKLIERQRATPTSADAFGTDGAVVQLSAASISSASTSQTMSHGKTSTAGMILVAIPAVLGLVMPARPLTASAIESRGISSLAPSRPGNTASNTTQLQRPATTTRNILDWLRTFSISDDLSKFNSQSADVIGFVYKDPRTKENQFWVSRFTVSCCVADAAAIGLLVQSDKVPALKADSWVRVTGKFQLGEFAGEKMPTLVADKIEITPQPDQPYLYP